jgi:hypothetical protein
VETPTTHAFDLRALAIILVRDLLAGLEQRCAQFSGSDCGLPGAGGPIEDLPGPPPSLKTVRVASFNL